MGPKQNSNFNRSTAIILFLLSVSLISNAEVTTTTGGSQKIANDSNYKKIGVTGSVQLDAFPQNAPGGKISGKVLECARDKDGKMGFCTNKDCSNSRGPNSGVKISDEFAEYIENYAYKCFEDMIKKFNNCDGGVAFCGVGGHAKRNARSNGDTGVPSRHSTGDAMDISGSLYCGMNKVVDLTVQGRSANQTEYDTLTNCLKEMPKEAAQREPDKYEATKGGCITCTGTKKPSNDGHDDHIHFSAPTRRPGSISGR